MPVSPRTPNRRQKSSNPELTFSPRSPQFNGYSSSRPSHSRRTSSNSIQSPVTPRPSSSYSRNVDFGSSNGFGTAPDGGNGLGNLADELAEAWDEEGEEEVEPRSPDAQLNGHGVLANGHTTPPLLASPSSISNRIPSRSPNKPASRSKHRRKQSQHGSSDYGSDPEEVDGISPSLEAHMAAIEHLAQYGTEANDSDTDDVISRVAERLRDLGSQSGMENGTSR
jgi:hypothetical protein